MKSFVMNGRRWQVHPVEPYHPDLKDEFGEYHIASTNVDTNTISYSMFLKEPFKSKVILHELGHCAIHSYNIVDDIHQMVYPEYWDFMEEWICNFIVDYGFEILRIGYDVFALIPYELDRLIG